MILGRGMSVRIIVPDPSRTFTDYGWSDAIINYAKKFIKTSDMTIEKKVIKAQELLAEVLAELNANKGVVKKTKSELEDLDDLYEEAKQIVIVAGKASTSLLQRRLQIGYARAAKLIDVLEENGIIGPVTKTLTRRVLVKTE